MPHSQPGKRLAAPRGALTDSVKKLKTHKYQLTPNKPPNQKKDIAGATTIQNFTKNKPYKH